MSDNKETKQEWAPARIWLQRGVGDDGSHTWCSDSQGEHEQAEYVRVDVQAPAVEAGARDESVSMIQTLMLDWINARAGKEAKAVWNRIEEKLVALDRASDAEAGEPIDYDRVVQICEAHGIGLPVDCIKMVVEIIRLAAPQPAIEPASSCDPADTVNQFAQTKGYHDGIHAIQAAPSASEQQAESLRRAVKAVVAMLKDGEYAEHWADAEAPGDADAADLEAAITELVSESHDGSEQQVARGLRDEQRRMLIRVSECLYVAGYQGLSGELVNAFSALLTAKGDGHA